MRNSRRWLVGALAASCLAVFGNADLVRAQTAQVCLAGQTRYTGTVCRGMAKCYVKAMKHSTSLDPECIPDRNDDLLARFNSVEAHNNCLTEPAGSNTSSMLQSGVSSFGSGLGNGACASKKMGALGRECKQMMACYSDSAAGSQPNVDPDCLQAAVDQLLNAFQKIEANEICNSTGDGSTRSDDVDSLTNSIWSYLRGNGTTTTSTTTTVPSTTTTTLPTCPENGSYTPCTGYRDNGACKACVDGFGGTAQTLCFGAAADSCGNADENTACGFAINTSTDCDTTCCPP